MTYPVRRRIVLLLCATAFLATLDSTIVSVAIPAIQDALRVGPTALVWIVDAYLIAFGGLQLVCGSIGDLIGHKRVLVLGVATAVVASLLSGLAQTGSMLIATRAMQGCADACSSAMILGLLAVLYPDPVGRRYAIGLYFAAESAGACLGFFGGGILTAVVSWRLIFLAQVPLNLALLIASRTLDSDPPSLRALQVDRTGIVLTVVIPPLAIYALIDVLPTDPLSARALLLTSTTLLLLLMFFLRETYARNPVIPLRHAIALLPPNLLQGLGAVGTFTVYLLGALYLQRIRGYDAAATGVVFLPYLLTRIACAWSVARHIAHGHSLHPPIVIGLAAVTTSLILFASLPAHGSGTYNVITAMLLLGIGTGLAFPCLTARAMAQATPKTAGLASGLSNATPQLLGALGLAVVTAVVDSQADSLQGRMVYGSNALLAGLHLGFVTAAAFALAALLGAIALALGDLLRGASALRPIRPTQHHQGGNVRLVCRGAQRATASLQNRLHSRHA